MGRWVRSNEDYVSNSLNIFPGVRPIDLSRFILLRSQSLRLFLLFQSPRGF